MKLQNEEKLSTHDSIIDSFFEYFGKNFKGMDFKIAQPSDMTDRFDYLVDPEFDAVYEEMVQNKE